MTGVEQQDQGHRGNSAGGGARTLRAGVEHAGHGAVGAVRVTVPRYGPLEGRDLQEHHTWVSANKRCPIRVHASGRQVCACRAVAAANQGAQGATSLNVASAA